MEVLLIAFGAFVFYLVAYHTYGKWLARKIFKLDATAAVPSRALNDDRDYVPTRRSIIFGHHFTSIAGTGPIVGPAVAVIWGWVPALLWVLIGSVFIGAMHDLGSLVVSMRNRGQTVGDIAGRLVAPRARLLFLSILFLALTIILAIFGLVIATVFRQYPASIFPCLVQIPLAVGIGTFLHRKGYKISIPSLVSLIFMYLVFTCKSSRNNDHFRHGKTIGENYLIGFRAQGAGILSEWPPCPAQVCGPGSNRVEGQCGEEQPDDRFGVGDPASHGEQVAGPFRERRHGGTA